MYRRKAWPSRRYGRRYRPRRFIRRSRYSRQKSNSNYHRMDLITDGQISYTFLPNQVLSNLDTSKYLSQALADNFSLVRNFEQIRICGMSIRYSFARVRGLSETALGGLQHYINTVQSESSGSQVYLTVEDLKSSTGTVYKTLDTTKFVTYASVYPKGPVEKSSWSYINDNGVELTNLWQPGFYTAMESPTAAPATPVQGVSVTCDVRVTVKVLFRGRRGSYASAAPSFAPLPSPGGRPDAADPSDPVTCSFRPRQSTD